MGHPPLTLFARIADPDGVLRILREAGEVAVDGTDDAWSAAVVRWKTGWFSYATLELRHDADYYSGPNWPKQRQGMLGYFVQLGALPDLYGRIGDLRFALNLVDAPVPTDPRDPVHALLRRLAAHVDGVFFTPGYLLDRDGRVLCGPGGERDPAAVLPALEPRPETDDDEPEPPPAARVARRALVLGAITSRALAELDPDPERLPGLRPGFLRWLDDVGASDELEVEERALLASPERPGPQALLNAVWRIEGLAVLCWALGLTELPAYDALVEPPLLWERLGVLRDPDQGRRLVAEASLRTQDELDAMQVHLLAFHWRVRDYRLRPRAMDFVAFSRSCWFGSFPLDDFTVVGGDLALGGVAIDEAGDEARARAASVAHERHQAINWLHRGGIYADVDTAT